MGIFIPTTTLLHEPNMKVAAIVLIASVATAQQFGFQSPNNNYYNFNDYNNQYQNQQQGNYFQPQSIIGQSAVPQLTSPRVTVPQSQFSNNNVFGNNQFSNNNVFGNNQFQNQFQDDYFRPNSQNRYEAEQRFQAETSEQYDNEFGGEFEPLNLPSGARFMLGDISSSFSCADRPYGYYADVDNFCRVFHVCNPTLFSDGVVQTYQYSMMCGEGTQFDQRTMTCVEQTKASPCQDAPNFYWINEHFGLPHEKQ